MFITRWLIAAFLLPCLACGDSLSLPDTVTIGNGTVMAKISPSIGRIVHFGFAGEKNLLWLDSGKNVEAYKKKKPDGWINYGGDKIWALQQNNWSVAFGAPWPPAPALEGLPWMLKEHSSTRAEFHSRPIPRLGIRLIREIEIPPGSQSVVIRNRIERYAPNPFPVQVWSITQIVSPEYCLLEVPAPLSSALDPFVEFFDKGSAELAAGGEMLRHSPRADGKEAKTGTLGSWVAAVYPDGVILLQYINAVQGACYPDSASVEAYSNKDYMELETLGEQRHLQPGEAMECKVVWCILKHAGKSAMVETINQAVQDIKKNRWM